MCMCVCVRAPWPPDNLVFDNLVFINRFHSPRLCRIAVFFLTQTNVVTNSPDIVQRGRGRHDGSRRKAPREERRLLR